MKKYAAEREKAKENCKLSRAAIARETHLCVLCSLSRCSFHFSLYLYLSLWLTLLSLSLGVWNKVSENCIVSKLIMVLLLLCFRCYKVDRNFEVMLYTYWKLLYTPIYAIVDFFHGIKIITVYRFSILCMCVKYNNNGETMKPYCVSGNSLCVYYILARNLDWQKKNINYFPVERALLMSIYSSGHNMKRRFPIKNRLISPS